MSRQTLEKNAKISKNVLRLARLLRLADCEKSALIIIASPSNAGYLQFFWNGSFG